MYITRINNQLDKSLTNRVVVPHTFADLVSVSGLAHFILRGVAFLREYDYLK